MPHLFPYQKSKSALNNVTTKKTILIAIMAAMVLAVTVFRLSSISVQSDINVSKSGSGDLSIGRASEAPPEQVASNKDVFKGLFPTLAVDLPGEDRQELRALLHHRSGNRPFLAILMAPTVTATKTDALFTDVDGDLNADPGDTLKYTVTINASGEDATGLTFTDTVDPNTAFVGGSLAATPVAVNDSYAAAGNIRISVAAPGVLGNDFTGLPTATITAPPITSANGGNVTLNANGSFTYNPPPGFEGNDSFTYTLTNSEGSNNATVTIAVNGMIWFVNNTASCPCDGRLTNPFNTLAAFNAVNNGVGNNPAANDNIFLYESGTDYVGPVTLLNGQKFIGQDATASLSSISGVTPPAGSDPLPATNSGNGIIVNITSAGNGINVASGNTLRGFTGGNAATDINGSGFGTLTVLDVTLNGSGQALNLSTGTLAATFGSISSTNSATTGVSLTSVGGSLTTPTLTITNPAGIGLTVNTSSGTLNFGGTNATQSGSTGVSLTTNTGPITFGVLNITPDAGQRGLLATNNSATITSTSGSITTTTATAVEITRASGTTPLVIGLTLVSATGGPNGIFLSNTSGSFTVAGSGGTCTFATPTCTGGRITTTTGADNSTAGVGVSLNNTTNVSLTRMRIDNHPNFAIRGHGVNGFTLQTSVVDGNNGTSATADTDIVNGEDSIRIINLIGSALIDDCFIGGGFEQNIRVVNDTGTLNRLTISDSSVGDLDGAGAGRGVDNTNGDDNINLEARTAGTVMNVTLTNNILNNARGDVIQTNASLGTTMDVVFRLNRVTNNHPNKVVAGGGSSFTGLGAKTYDISCNSFRDSNGIGLNVFRGRPANGTTGGNWSGTIFNNTVGVTGVQNSGAADGASGIAVDVQGNGTHTVLIKNNVVRNHGEAGIRVNVIDANTAAPMAVTMNATVIGNLVAEPDPINGFAGFFAVQGAVPGADANTTLNLRLGSQPTAAEKNNLNDGSAVTNDAFLQRAAGAIGAFNLSRAGSASATATQVVIDDNIVNAASVFTDAGIVLVNPNPALPAAINEACTPPTAPDKIDGEIPGASGDVSTPGAPGDGHGPGAPGDIGTPGAPAPATDSILNRPFISSPRPEAVKATTKPAPTLAPPLAAPRVDQPGTNSTRDTRPPKPQEQPPGATPPVIGPGGASITWNVGTLPAGQSVTLIFDVQVENPYSGPPQVSNQGTVTFGGGGGPVLTDDPSVVGLTDPTVTPIAVPPDVFLRDAKVAEPTSGTTSMLFTVALSAPAGTNIPINYSTTNGTAVEPGDYVAPVAGSTTILAGEQIKIIPITVNSDVDNAEVDENFTLTITANSALANIVDGTGVGTITVANVPGTLLISEVRTSGPSGSADEFVEIYNNTDTPHTVAASDASPGYGVFKMGADCNATPILVGTIPNGTVIPARGHYLLVGSAYSLGASAAGNLTMTSDIQNDRPVSIYSTTSILNLSTTTRFDGVGFGLNTGAVCDLQREGTNLNAAGGSTSQYTFFRHLCAYNVPTVQCTTPGTPKDTNDNVVDFAILSTTPAVPVGSNAAPLLGAPGPENLTSPIRRDPGLQSVLLDQSIVATQPPNRVRTLENDGDPFTTNGTLSVRRRIINNTGAPVTRLRIRVVEITTFPSPGGGVADVRAITSVNVSVPNVNDAATCTASGAGPPPCTVTVKGTTLETPPAQPNGGGYNSTLADVTITPGAQLAPGASANVQFLLAVQTTGTFRFLLIIEALP